MPDGTILVMLLAAGATLTLMSARAAPPGVRGLTVSLALAAVLTFFFYYTSDRMNSSMAFALAAGAGAATAAIDARHHLLPDTGAGLIALGALVSAMLRGDAITALIAGAISAAVLILAAMLTYRPGRGKPLGEGDVLLAGACGLWLTLEQVPYALIGATALTAAVGFTFGVRRSGSSDRMAFGPGLAAGYGIAAVGLIPIGFVSW